MKLHLTLIQKLSIIFLFLFLIFNTLLFYIILSFSGVLYMLILWISVLICFLIFHMMIQIKARTTLKKLEIVILTLSALFFIFIAYIDIKNNFAIALVLLVTSLGSIIINPIIFWFSYKKYIDTI